MAYGGFAVDERKYRGLVAAVYQAKRRYVCVAPTGLSDAERIELAKQMIVQDLPLERTEIKAGKLLGARQIRRLQDEGFSPGLSLVSSMLDALMEADATVFGVLCRPQTPNDVLDPPAQLPIEYIRLFERVEKWMSEVHPDGMVSIIPDNLNSINGRFSKCLADFLFRAALARSMRHLVVTPFWSIPASQSDRRLPTLLLICLCKACGHVITVCPFTISGADSVRLSFEVRTALQGV